MYNYILIIKCCFIFFADIICSYFGKSNDTIGTGITESILSGLLSMEGNKILNIDKNPYYGDSGASLNLTKMWDVFKPG